ncbi:MAG TPA: cytochrome c [Steroidobacteraceae bacterium]
MRIVAQGLLLAVSLAVTASAFADDQDVIDYRKHIMKSMDEQLAAIHMILEKKAPADNFAVHLQILAVVATEAKSAFEPKVPGGNSKPEVWSNWADFAKRLDGLVSSTADLAKAAQADGVAAVGPRLQSALDCKSCHDLYMLPAK